MRSCEGNVAGKKMEGGGCHQQWFHLWVLIDFLLVLLVAINVKPNGCPGTACPAEPEDDPWAVGEDDPQTLTIGKTGNRDDEQNRVLESMQKYHEIV